jgi:V/A-type H+-transporting ATPase subunit E
MAEELKELLEKIQTEGVKAAEEKARSILSHAEARAGEIVQNAEKEALGLVAAAREQITRLEEGSRVSIKQAARDMMLALRKEIASTLERLVGLHVHKALGPEDLAKILVTVIKGCGSGHKDQIVVSLRKEDLERVEKALFSELGQEAKKGILLKAAADIHGGFLISYDSGKSYFDFSDRALAEYLASHLKGALAEIVKEASPKQEG